MYVEKRNVYVERNLWFLFEENRKWEVRLLKVIMSELMFCVYVFLCVQARDKQTGELAAIKVIKMEPGEKFTRSFTLTFLL